MNRDRVSEIKESFSDLWVDFAKQHQEDMLLLDWIEVFGVLSATVMLNSTCDPDDVEELLEQMSEFAYDVYQDQAHKFLNNIQ